MRLESPAVLTRGDRFIIRAYSPPVTIGGGVGQRIRRRRGPESGSEAGEASLERVRIDRDGARRAVRSMIDGAGLAGIAPRRWSRARRAADHRVGVDAAGARGRVGWARSPIDWLPLPRLTKASDRAPRDGSRVSQGQSDERRACRERKRAEKIFARVSPAIFERVG